MVKQMKTGAGVVAGLAALALGGSAIASAASGNSGASVRTPIPAASHIVTPAHQAAAGTSEKASAPDTDTIQSGDQGAKDQPDGTARAASGAQDKADGGVEQSSGAQDGPDQAGETASASDGPGGYADPVGNAQADTQQQGEH